jgi:hypothetical protein
MGLSLLFAVQSELHCAGPLVQAASAIAVRATTLKVRILLPNGDQHRRPVAGRVVRLGTSLGALNEGCAHWRWQTGDSARHAHDNGHGGLGLDDLFFGFGHG